MNVSLVAVVALLLAALVAQRRVAGPLPLHLIPEPARSMIYASYGRIVSEYAMLWHIVTGVPGKASVIVAADHGGTLFLGDVHDAAAAGGEMTHVLSLNKGATRCAARVHHCHLLPLRDVHDAPLASVLPRALALLDEAMSQSGSRVLVHCRHGRSRSAAIVAAWLRHSDRAATLQEALRTVKQKRDVVNINDGFKDQLARYFEAKHGV